MFDKHTHFHFIGICGIGMSGIAKILLQQNYKVSGCDKNLDPIRVNELKKLGCIINHHQSQACSDSSINIIVRSSDIFLTHPEIIAAKNKNISIKLRAEILADIMQEHNNSIAIAGSHGKTTTSSLLSHILLQTDLNPTIIVGGHIHNINSNAEYRNKNYLVAEADESDKSFLFLPKKFTITTNIDQEHLGVYKDLEDIKNNFLKFINTTTQDGLNILCIDNSEVKSIIPQINTKYKTYGISNQATFQIKNIKLEEFKSSFTIFNNESKTDLGTWSVNLPGHHNVLNATSTIILGLHLGLTPLIIQKGLNSFQGVDRRFTLKGISKNGALIYDDYAHHPTEIKATLPVARKIAKNKLIVIFQPQRYSRTKHLWNEFIDSFATSIIDELIITDIYPANEPSIPGISSLNMVKQIKDLNSNLSITYLPFTENGQKIIDLITLKSNKNDLILFLGAGKINQLISSIK